VYSVAFDQYTVDIIIFNEFPGGCVLGFMQAYPLNDVEMSMCIGHVTIMEYHHFAGLGFEVFAQDAPPEEAPDE
jgi:hypothetical protein